MPIQIKANNETKIEYQTYQGQIAFNNSGNLVEDVKADFPPKPLAPHQATSYGLCACASYLESLFSQISGIGQASNWPINSQIGAVGEVIVFTYDHVALIKGMTANGYILDETNYIHCVHTTDRLLPFNDPTIRGYWSPAL